MVPRFTQEDLSYQASIAEGSLALLAEHVADVEIRDLFSVAEAFHLLTEAIRKCGKPI